MWEYLERKIFTGVDFRGVTNNLQGFREAEKY
jgi:hypothetical protein